MCRLLLPSLMVATVVVASLANSVWGPGGMGRMVLAFTAAKVSLMVICVFCLYSAHR